VGDDAVRSPERPLLLVRWASREDDEHDATFYEAYERDASDSVHWITHTDPDGARWGLLGTAPGPDFEPPAGPLADGSLAAAVYDEAHAQHRARCRGRWRREAAAVHAALRAAFPELRDPAVEQDACEFAARIIAYGVPAVVARNAELAAARARHVAELAAIRARHAHAVGMVKHRATMPALEPAEVEDDAD
jgi:hypothetical protein